MVPRDSLLRTRGRDPVVTKYELTGYSVERRQSNRIRMCVDEESLTTRISESTPEKVVTHVKFGSRR